MKNDNIDKSKIGNRVKEKHAAEFFAKSGSPKNFKETIKLLLNLVVNLFG